MKGIKIKYCINEKLCFISVQTKTQIARNYNMSPVMFGYLTNFIEPVSYDTIKKYGFEDKFIEPVLWYTKEKRVVRFKDATTEIEKQIIKIYEENNESKR